MTLTIGLINTSLPSYFPQRHGVFDDARALLNKIAARDGYTVVEADSIPMNAAQAGAAVAQVTKAGADLILLLHGGFTMGDVVRKVALSPLPLGIWATPEPTLTGDVQLNNFVSLNMSMSIARGVRNMNANPVQWYFGSPDDTALVARLKQTLTALQARVALHGARIGMIGGLAPTFFNMEVSSDTLMRKLGVSVEHIDLHVMTELMGIQREDDIRAELAEITAAADVCGVSDAQMELTVRAVLALRSMASDGGYDALTVSDWPALQQHPGMHPGAAFSWLEEKDRLPVASEGDVLGAVSQLVVKSFTGKVGCLLDMTSPDLEADKILMWHGGGGPLYMARNGVSWINHPMIGRGTDEGPVFGAIADYEFALGDVTVLRISRHGTAHFVVEGQVSEASESGFDGCRGWVGSFKSSAGNCSANDIVTTVMEQGLEHHFVLVQGKHLGAFTEFGQWSCMTPMDIIPAHAGLPSP